MSPRRGVDPVPPKVREVAEKQTRELAREGIAHALIGGLAVGEHGYPRATTDVDFIISADDFPKIVGASLAVGLTKKVSGVRVDFITVEPEEPFLEDAIHDARGSPPIIPAGALVYLKLKAGRRRDQSDVVEMVKRGGVNVEQVRRYLTRIGADEILADFESLVDIAELEED